MKFYILVHRVIIFICLFNFKTFMIEDIVVDFYLAKKRKKENKGEVREFFFFFKSNQGNFLGKKDGWK